MKQNNFSFINTPFKISSQSAFFYNSNFKISKRNNNIKMKFMNIQLST